MPITNQARTAYLVLRVGAALAFLYPPLSALFGDPYSWLGYFPPFVVALLPDFLSELAFLHFFGVVEVLIGLWILSGYKIFIPSLLATGLLVGIVVFNSWQFDVLFRDLSIACLTLALAILHLPKRPSTLS